MINDSRFDQSHFVISYELLKLLEWLMDHEQDELKKLINRAIERGFVIGDKIGAANDNQQLQYTVVEFFLLLDALLYESVDDEKNEEALQRALVPAINNIDTRLYDFSTIQTSIAKATAAAENNTSKDAKDILCKELLKRWKPSKRVVTH